MIPLSELLEKLEYTEAPHYHHTTGSHPPETAHIFRAAQHAGVSGIYVCQTSSAREHSLLPPRPAIYFAEVPNQEEAKRVHRRLWNLSYAPIIVLVLPNRIQVYTGFDYSEAQDSVGLIRNIETSELLTELLINLNAAMVDSGRVWLSDYAALVDPEKRVDKRLLKNLEELSRVLENHGLPGTTANSLIGKYVYFSYLRDRQILSESWMQTRGIDPARVFSAHADIHSLRGLSDAVEKRFNGKIFPIDFSIDKALRDEHVSWVASVFAGDRIFDGPEIIRQLHLPFKAYDFEYIPVETLSAIYEQFIYDRKDKGAVYTPEILADYVLSEVEAVKPLVKGCKILDPACGSGVFLVLAYRRIIEKEMQNLERRLKPEELHDILVQSIYGVEREKDACYVTEFSLLLTLLHYSEPRDLQEVEFQFATLHETHIFEADFFDFGESKKSQNIWNCNIRFDVVIGNPPWVELTGNKKQEVFARAWMIQRENKKQRPIGGLRVAEAFSWVVVDLLMSDGIVGLILPATSLFNLTSKKYRQAFFTQHEVFRITNFANLRNVLFGGRSELPAMTIIYRCAVDGVEKLPIIHNGPFSINQMIGVKHQSWYIAINDNEVQLLSPYEAEKGETLFWKLALWGSLRDKRALNKITRLFPHKLMPFCMQRGWAFRRDIELRDASNSSQAEIEYVPSLKNSKLFHARTMTNSLFHFTVPDNVLRDLPDEMCFVRKRGGKSGLEVVAAPHITMSPGWRRYIVYSDDNFVPAAKHITISASANDAEQLKALSIFLHSSIVAYYLFFHAQEWGIFRHARLVSITEVASIPLPEMTPEQISRLAGLHSNLVSAELDMVKQVNALLASSETANFVEDAQKNLVTNFNDIHKTDKGLMLQVNRLMSEFLQNSQSRIDAEVQDAFAVAEDLSLLVQEFVSKRLLLDQPSAYDEVMRQPTKFELLEYSRELRDRLDSFLTNHKHHRVTVNYSNELVECVVEMTNSSKTIAIDEFSVRNSTLSNRKLLANLNRILRNRMSQWVYVQRSLRLYDGPKVYLYKQPRTIDWTRAQAIDDAGDIIGQAIETSRGAREDN